MTLDPHSPGGARPMTPLGRTAVARGRRGGGSAGRRLARPGPDARPDARRPVPDPPAPSTPTPGPCSKTRSATPRPPTSWSTPSPATRSRGGTRTRSAGCSSGRSPSSPRSASTWSCSPTSPPAGPTRPHLSREQALTQLAHLVKTLRDDQRDPTLAAEGLLSNFLDLATGKRLGPLASNVDKSQVPRRLRPREGRGALEGPASRPAGSPPARTAARPTSPARSEVRRRPLRRARSPRSTTPATRQKILAILDARVVMLVFGDNSNLSASAAKTIGALLVPEVKDRPEAVADPPTSSKQFLEAQQPGYARLYDAEGRPVLLRLGRHPRPPLRLGRPPGEPDDRPHGLPRQRVPGPRHLRRRPVRPADRRDRQPRLQDEALPDRRTAATSTPSPPGRARRSRRSGLGLSLGERDRPSWRALLTNVVDIEVDFAIEEGPARLPLRVVHRRRDPVHRERRHPRDHRQPPAPDHRRRLALHPGRGLLDRARPRSRRSWPRTGRPSRR